MPAYSLNKELKVLADSIITSDRPMLKHLTIAYVFRPEAPVSEGKATAGMCVRLDDRNWTIHKTDFIIAISAELLQISGGGLEVGLQFY